MKKIFKMIALVFCFNVALSSFVYASEYDNDYKENELDSEYQLGEGIKVEGVLSPIEVEKDLTKQPIENEIAPQQVVPVSINITTLSGPTKVKRLVRYLTSSWAKASQYTWNKSQSAS